jgi:heat shock protein HslJ
LKAHAPFVILLSINLLLAGCASAATPEPTSSSGPLPVPAIDGLTNTGWHWVQTTETQPASQSVVPDPENYSITFADDGSVAIVADCNRVQGIYEASGSILTITTGASTMAFCGGDSSDTFFLERLSQVDTVEVQEDRLLLGYGNGAGTLVFAPPEQAASSAERAALSGIVWQWSQLVESNPASQSVVPDPASYTLAFNADGTYAIQADCNQLQGGYTLEGQTMAISPGPSTLAACGPESQDAFYLDKLSRVTAFSLEGGNLTLFADDGETRMVFFPAE